MSQLIHSIQYSIIKRIEDEVPELSKVVWMAGDVELKKEDLPFATVEHLYSSTRYLDKIYGYEATDYYFQIGVRARNTSELNRLVDKVKHAFIRESIPLYDTSQPFPPPQIDELRTEITLINPMFADEVNDTTGKHRCYLDCSVFYPTKL